VISIVRTLADLSGEYSDALIQAWIDYVTEAGRDWSGRDLTNSEIISACIAGISHIGAESQISHAENGLSASFKDADAIDYIRRTLPVKVEVYSL